MIPEITIKISMPSDGVTVSTEQAGEAEETFTVPPLPGGEAGSAG